VGIYPARRQTESPPLNITERVHQRLRAHLRAGDTVIDATAGNGHDTLFVARCVVPEGHVFAVDIQQAAIALTRSRLESAAVGSLCTLMCADHSRLAALIPRKYHGQIAAALFNLGYLPGGDHALTTHSASTLHALDAALRLLRPGGVLSVVCYPGHPEGAREAAAVESWAHTVASAHARIAIEKPQATRRPPPFLVWAERTD